MTLHCSVDDTEYGRKFIILEFFLSKAPGSIRLRLGSIEVPTVIDAVFLRLSCDAAQASEPPDSVNVDWMPPMLREGQLNIENGPEDVGLTRGAVEYFEEMLWFEFQHSGH